jgi:hypothetical protein
VLAPDLAELASSTSPLNTLLTVDPSLLEEVDEDETDVRPTALVTLFRLSTVSKAGPLLKKSTRIKVGWRPPYAVLHLVAVLPRLPVPPDGAFTVDT